MSDDIHKPPHPTVQWPEDNGRPTVTCPDCHKPRTLNATSTAEAIREYRFTGLCAKCSRRRHKTGFPSFATE